MTIKSRSISQVMCYRIKREDMVQTAGQTPSRKRNSSQQVSGKNFKGHYYNLLLNLGLVKGTFIERELKS